MLTCGARSRGQVLILAALVMLGGCSSAPVERTSPSVPVTTSAVPAVSVNYSARRQATIAVMNGDGLVAAAGAVWVKTDDGRAVRIDPATNRVTDEFKLDTVADESQYCQGIGTDGLSVWACATADDGTGLAQIDPKARRVLRRVSVGKVFDQLALPSAGRGVWVLTADGTRASVVEPATGRVTAYPLGSRYLQLAALADRVVATSATENAVVVLDAANGAVVGRISLPKPGMAALAGTDLWIDTEAGLARVTRGLVTRSVYTNLGAGSGGDLIAAGGAVWVRGSDGAITKVDLASGRVVERITPEQPLTAGSLLVAFGSIWTTSSDQGIVVRLRLEP